MIDSYNRQHTHAKVDPYRYFNYAILHTKGVDHLFDTMRYDTAFFVRRSDVDRILEAAREGNAMLSRFSILLCKYDWKGATKPTWTPARLLSHQEFEYIDDPMSLVDLRSEEIGLRPAKPLKIRTDVEIEAKLPEILLTMYSNHAVPADEKSALEIESAFYRPIDADPFKVRLVNYQPLESEWRIPTP